MKLMILFPILLFGVVACNDDNDECIDLPLLVHHLESKYACSNVDANLDEAYLIIRNSIDFSTYVNTTCGSEIDFSTYDLVIGKKTFTSGVSSIQYELIKYCDKENPSLTITFTLNDTTEAPNITFNALLPKLDVDQEVNVELVIK